MMLPYPGSPGRPQWAAEPTSSTHADHPFRIEQSERELAIFTRRSHRDRQRLPATRISSGGSSATSSTALRPAGPNLAVGRFGQCLNSSLYRMALLCQFLAARSMGSGNDGLDESAFAELRPASNRMKVDALR